MSDSLSNPIRLTPTPLESALHDQWQGKDVEMPQAPWAEAKARARERIEAFAAGTGTEVPTELDSWIDALPSEWMVRFVLMVRAVGQIQVACTRARISPYVLTKWRNECPAFAEAIARAREAAVATVESALFVSGTIGDPVPKYDKGLHVGWERKKSEKAAEILLRAELPGKYRPEQGGNQVVNVQLPSGEAVMSALKRLGGAPVQIEDTKDVPHTETCPNEDVK